MKKYSYEDDKVVARGDSVRLLLVEDEPSLAKIMLYELNHLGYTVDYFARGDEAWEHFGLHHYDFAILDWMLPGVSGIELIQRMKTKHNKTIIMMISAKGDEMDVVEALELGADDYLVKPFSTNELIARIKAHERRIGHVKQTDSLQMGCIVLDVAKYTAHMNNSKMVLTKKEFDLLHFLMINQDVILSRQQLLDKVWGFEFEGNTRIVDVFIFRLRELIKGSGVMIETVRGYGYCLALTKS